MGVLVDEFTHSENRCSPPLRGEQKIFTPMYYILAEKI